MSCKPQPAPLPTIRTKATSTHCLSNCSSYFQTSLSACPASHRNHMRNGFLYTLLECMWHYHSWQWSQVWMGDPSHFCGMTVTHSHALTGKACPLIPPCLSNCVVWWLCLDHTITTAITRLHVGVCSSVRPSLVCVMLIVVISLMLGTKLMSMIWKMSKCYCWKKIHLFVELAFYGFKLLVWPPSLFFSILDASPPLSWSSTSAKRSLSKNNNRNGQHKFWKLIIVVDM